MQNNQSTWHNYAVYLHFIKIKGGKLRVNTVMAVNSGTNVTALLKTKTTVTTPDLNPPTTGFM